MNNINIAKWLMVAAVLLAGMVLPGHVLRVENAAASGCPFPPSQVLWFEKPAAKWGVDTLPLGNGRPGAMSVGGMQKERIQFNENSLCLGNEQVESKVIQSQVAAK